MLQERREQYGFVVDRRASKIDIKNAIELFYGVEVERVNTMVMPGKSKKNRKTGQITGRTNIYKKAVIKLKDGFSIDFFETI